MKQSKALLKLGVATDLGTAIRTSPGKSDSISPDVKSKKKAEATTADAKTTRLSVLNPNKKLDSKSWTKFLAEKIQKEIEDQAASQKEPSYTLAEPGKQQQQRSSTGRRRSSALPKSSTSRLLAKIPETSTPTQTRIPYHSGTRGGTGGGVSDLGRALGLGYGNDTKKPQTATSTAAEENADDTDDDGVSSSVAGDRESISPSDTDRESIQSRRSTAPGTANKEGTAAAKTADQTSEIDLLEEQLGDLLGGEDEAYQECMKQSKPMVLNLDDLRESTIEVLEYEAERPIDIDA